MAKRIDFEIKHTRRNPKTSKYHIYDIFVKVDGEYLNIDNVASLKDIQRTLAPLYRRIFLKFINQERCSFVIHLNRECRDLGMIGDFIKNKKYIIPWDQNLMINSTRWEVKGNVSEESTDIILRLRGKDFEKYFSRYWFSPDEKLFKLYLISSDNLYNFSKVAKLISNQPQSIAKLATMVIDNLRNGFHFRIFSKDELEIVIG